MSDSKVKNKPLNRDEVHSRDQFRIVNTAETYLRDNYIGLCPQVSVKRYVEILKPQTSEDSKNWRIAYSDVLQVDIYLMMKQDRILDQTDEGSRSPYGRLIYSYQHEPVTAGKFVDNRSIMESEVFTALKAKYQGEIIEHLKKAVVNMSKLEGVRLQVLAPTPNTLQVVAGENTTLAPPTNQPLPAPLLEKELKYSRNIDILNRKASRALQKHVDDVVIDVCDLGTACARFDEAGVNGFSKEDMIAIVNQTVTDAIVWY